MGTASVFRPRVMLAEMVRVLAHLLALTRRVARRFPHILQGAVERVAERARLAVDAASDGVDLCAITSAFGRADTDGRERQPESFAEGSSGRAGRSIKPLRLDVSQPKSR
jgi:hypothetical protein